MEDKNKFEKMIDESRKRPSVSRVEEKMLDRQVEREVKEQAKKTKSRSKKNTASVSEPIILADDNQTNEASVQKVNLNEIRQLQQEIHQENGDLQQENIETNNAAQSSETSQSDVSAIDQKENSESGNAKSEEITSNENQVIDNSLQKTNIQEDNLASETSYREKKEIDEKLATNSNVSRVNDAEIAKLKREIALEKGLLSADDVVDEDVSKNAKSTLNDSKNDAKTAKSGKKVENVTDDTNSKNGSENTKKNENQADDKASENENPSSEGMGENGNLNNQIPQASNGFQAHTVEVIDKDDKDDNVLIDDHVKPPETSQPDNITDEEIQQLLLEQEEQAKQDELKEEEEIYEGMTEEEIADAKERKRKFAELKIRYNAKDVSVNGDIGDYKKNLDFSVNTSIKRFRVSPPKKPFIIATVVLAFVFALVGVITYFALNKPPEKVKLTNITISQEYSYQYVGQPLDFTGIYAVKHYSNGEEEKEQIVETMIENTSSNISNDYLILSYDENTYVNFVISGYEIKLKISLTEIVVTSISNIRIMSNSLKLNSTLSFNDILILLNVEYHQGDIIDEQTDTIVFDARNVNAFVNDKAVTKNENGFLISDDLFVSGENTIEFVISINDKEFKFDAVINL